MIRSLKLTLKTFAVAGLIYSGGYAIAEEKETKITFDDHIKPIFREHCTACHAAGDKASDLALDTYGATLAGGAGGNVVAQGDVLGSRLFALVAHTEQPYMPPDEDPIPKEQQELLRVWIEQGMPENSGSKIKRSNAAAAAMLGNVSIGKPDGPPPMPEKILREAVVVTDRAAAISAMSASPWAPLFAVGGQEQVSLYHSETGELLGVIPFPEGEPQSLRFTRDGKQLLIGGGQHSVSGCAVLVDIATGERITKVGDELDTVLAADISPDKSRIAVAGPQKIIRIYDSLSGEKLLELEKHTDWIFSLRYSPDGILLASGDRSNGLIVWEADTGTLYGDLTGHQGAVRSVDFRADSNVLVSGSMDGTIKLWDMFESKAIKSWNAHGGGVTSVQYANDGSIASSGRDARIKLWDGGGTLKNEFTGLSEAALEVALTGDATAIAGGDWYGKVQMWPAGDPKTVVPIASNPPSIDTRMTQAQSAVAAVEQNLANTAAAAAQAAEKAESASKMLSDANNTLTATDQQLNATTAEQQRLQALLGNQDSQIAQLEQQLAQLKTARGQTITQLDAAKAEVTRLTATLSEVRQKVEAGTQVVEGLKTNAAAAAAEKAKVEAQLAIAQATLDKVIADKAALAARAAELAKISAESTSKAEALASELESVTTTQQAKEAEMAKLAAELAAMTQQLSELQKRLSEAQNAKQVAEEIVSKTSEQSSALESELQAAQQAALDAQERLKLFEQSYRKPN